MSCPGLDFLWISYKVEVVLNRNSLSMFKKFSWLAGYYQSFWGRWCQDPMILLLRKDVKFHVE